MKFSKCFASALLILPAYSFGDTPAAEEAPERCITVMSGVSETSKQLKSLASDMGWDLGSFKAMKVAGVLKGKTMSSKGQVDVCLKASEEALNYQIRVGQKVDDQEWEELSDDKL
jgi:hypothetical protein